MDSNITEKKLKQGRLSSFNMKELSIDGKLNDGTTVTVCVTGSFIRIDFSDDRPPIML